MPLSNRNYDSYFSEKELKRIKFLRFIDRESAFWGWVIGIVISIFVFFIQIPLKGNNLIHAVCTFGSIPTGIVIGIGAYYFITWYVDNELLKKWDPLFYKRCNKTPEHFIAEAEVLKLTDDMNFICLPLNEQRAIVNKIYSNLGLPEPNDTDD